MAQSTKKTFRKYGTILGIITIVGIVFWGFGIVSYVVLQKVSVYTKTPWETVRACSYVPICFPLLIALTIGVLYFVNRKSRISQILTISIALVFGMGFLYPIILWGESSTFLSKQVVYTGTCVVLKADIVGQGTDQHTALTIACANGRTIVNTTPNLIAFVVNHPGEQLHCKLSPRDDLYCGQPE